MLIVQMLSVIIISVPIQTGIILSKVKLSGVMPIVVKVSIVGVIVAAPQI